jgi:hypothetical protein
MKMTAEQKSGLHSRKGQIIMILALGSICGLIEVVLSGALRTADFPWRAGLLTGLGLGIIAFAYAIYRKPIIALGIGFVAVLVKQLAVPVLGQTFVCNANSCLAVGLEYSALAAVALFTMKKMQNNGGLRFLTGGAGAFIGSIGFLLIGMHVAPCNYLLSFNQAGGFVSYLYKESLNWTLFSAALFPLGWLVGVKYEASLARLFENKPRVIYAGASVISVVCWAVSAIAIAGGM